MSEHDEKSEPVPGFVHTTIVPIAECTVCNRTGELITPGATVGLCLRHAYQVASIAAQHGTRPYSLAEAQAIEVANRAWAASRGPQ